MITHEYKDRFDAFFAYIIVSHNLKHTKRELFIIVMINFPYIGAGVQNELQNSSGSNNSLHNQIQN